VKGVSVFLKEELEGLGFLREKETGKKGRGD